MRKQEELPQSGNLTAMIDVVFQIIIFFVCTANLQDSGLDSRIKLAMAPHGKVETKKDPLQVVINVDKSGTISIARTPLTQAELASVLRKSVNEAKRYGGEVPVVIRADGGASHQMVRQAMDISAASGIWKIKIAALKEKGD